MEKLGAPRINMRNSQKEVLKTAACSVLGGAAGAGTYGVIGGVGLTVVGTGVGITLGPFIAIGAGLGAAGYGIFWAGKQIERSRNGRSATEDQ